MKVMDDMLTAVPLLLQKLKSSDILPAPCLKKFIHVEEKEEKELRENLEMRREVLLETGFESDCWQEGDDNERHPNSPNVIYADKLGRRQGKSANYDKLFRLNPLAKIITSSDIKQFQRGASKEKIFIEIDRNFEGHKWDKPTNSMAYIVHAGYGNETYDSVLRQVIIIPLSLRSSADLLLEVFTKHQEVRLAAFTSDNQKATKKRDRDHEAIVDQQWQSTGHLTIRSIALRSVNEKYDLQDMGKVFEAFFVAGALTLIE